uniref:Uncharacterized protein n=1 Tax=Mus musculus TaxID=10090 RepID=Q8C5A1_MOUSE|nr:unnamed protein product [Mus musculus]
MSVPFLPAESWGSAECWLLRTHHGISQPGPPVALASRASEIPGPAAFPTPRTAGDALPLLQLKLLATSLCRPPGFCRAEPRSVSASLLDDSDFVVLQLLEM